MVSFYEDIQNLVTLAGDDQPCLITMLRNAIRAAALLGKTEETFNLKEHKVLDACELLDIANLIEEGFKVEVRLDLAAQDYPSLSIKVNWEKK